MTVAHRFGAAAALFDAPSGSPRLAFLEFTRHSCINRSGLSVLRAVRWPRTFALSSTRVIRHSSRAWPSLRGIASVWASAVPKPSHPWLQGMAARTALACVTVAGWRERQPGTRRDGRSARISSDPRSCAGLLLSLAGSTLELTSHVDDLAGGPIRKLVATVNAAMPIPEQAVHEAQGVSTDWAEATRTMSPFMEFRLRPNGAPRERRKAAKHPLGVCAEMQSNLSFRGADSRCVGVSS